MKNNEIKAKRGQKKEEIKRQYASTLSCTGEEQRRGCESKANPRSLCQTHKCSRKRRTEPRTMRKERCRMRGPAPVSSAGMLKDSHCACATLMRSFTRRKQSLGSVGVNVVIYSEAAEARTAEAFTRIRTKIISILYFLIINIPSTWEVFGHSPASVPRCNVTSVCNLDWDWRKGQFESFLLGLPTVISFTPVAMSPG